MSMFDMMRSYSSDSNVISKIPIMKYPDLCNCVFCWEYSNVKTCRICDKLFCSEHEENHLCFTENTNSISEITTEPFEVCEIR